MSENKIRVLTAAPEVAVEDNEMGMFRRRSSDSAGVREIDAGTIAKNLSGLCSSISGMLEEAESAAGSFKLQEIGVSVEISAEGNVTLIGIAQVGTSGTGAISLTFTR